MKKLLIAIIQITIAFTPMVSIGNERADINLLLQELNYLEETVLKLKQENQNVNEKIRFNYDAMLIQIKALKEGTSIYLNHDIRSIHDTPPRPVVNKLTKIRKN